MPKNDSGSPPWKMKTIWVCLTCAYKKMTPSNDVSKAATLMLMIFGEINKTLLGKMTVKTEDIGQVGISHDVKAGEVNQRELLAVGSYKYAHGEVMNWLIYPDDVEYWDDISMEQAHRFDAKAVLKQGNCLKQYVITAIWG